MKLLLIGDKVVKIPVIQGGMGVISSAQAGFDEEDFFTNHCEANIRAIKKYIRKAKEISNGGLVGVNIMTSLKDYKEHVKASVEAGADVVKAGVKNITPPQILS